MIVVSRFYCLKYELPLKDADEQGIFRDPAGNTHPCLKGNRCRDIKILSVKARFKVGLKTGIPCEKAEQEAVAR